jgi:integrase
MIASRSVIDDEPPRMFGRLVAAAGIRPITLRGLRHAFATLGLETGVDVLEVAAVLGLSSWG